MNHEQMKMLNRELALEEEMLGLGGKRFWDQIFRAIQGEQESTTPYGSQLMKEYLPKLGGAIVALCERHTGKRGPRPIAVKYLKSLEPKVAAFITIKTVLDCLSQKSSIQKVSVSIGSAIEDEMRFRLFSEEAAPLWKRLKTDMDARIHSQERKRSALVYNMEKASKKKHILAWKSWGQVDRYHLGYHCLMLMIQATGMVRKITLHGLHNRSHTVVQATDQTMEWIKGKNARCALLSPLFFPTIIPPKPWTTPFNGGYYSKAIRPLKLVKTRQENCLEELAHKAEEMPRVYEAVNAVQDTPWRINRRILEVMQVVWDRGTGAGEVPAQRDIPLPPKPADIATNKDARVAWKRAASKVYGASVRLRSKRLQMVKLLYLAEKFQEVETIYFPHQLDFRGRLYAVPSYLNPQGNDAAKSLLEFSPGKPLGKQGNRWLQIHAANTYGADKCSLDGRVLWAEEHMSMILRCAEDPLASQEWTDADKPWQFLAVCFEIQTANNNPAYVSHLPVSVDGACNGLQNFSAMLRDEIGGAATNLVPNKPPQDIYQRVADVVRVKVEADAASGVALAQQWVDFGFDRKATKHPVMVLPYGGTQYSTRQYLPNYITERCEAGAKAPWGDDHWSAAVYLGRHLWKSIGEVVVAACRAMDWLQKVASITAGLSDDAIAELPPVPGRGRMDLEVVKQSVNFFA